MIKTIKYHPRFEKQCNKLTKSGAKARKAVKKALDVLAKFKTSKDHFGQLGSLSHHGELRIKDCIKYRLGNGYRLIVLPRKEALFTLFIGSHDQCNQWLETNRGTDTFCFSSQERVLIKNTLKKNTQTPDSDRIDPNRSTPFEDKAFTPVEDKILRQVFKGLCHPAN